MTGMVEVKPEDRDRAELLYEELHPDANWNGDDQQRALKIEQERIALGMEDGHPIVQHLARHRIAAEAAKR